MELHYLERGTGDETVVFSHSYLVDHQHFAAQVEALEPHFRVLAYDHRDHGRSARATADYELDDLIDDAVALIEHLGAAPCHFVGLSTGGFIGMRLALRRPQLLRSLVLMDTAAGEEPLIKRLKYQAMFLVLRALGIQPLLGTAMRLMFHRATLGDPSRRAEMTAWRERIGASDPRALMRFGNAIFARGSVLEQLHRITTPTLVMVGEHDRATPPVCARRIAEAIPGARLEVIPRAAHLCTVDAAEAVNAVLVPFIRAQHSGARSGA
jgi:pimeloyl-ACP methyl ester carboxylesterase